MVACLLQAHVACDQTFRYEAAASWYDDHSPGAGDDFAQAIERAEWLIAEMPRAWPQ
jgi:hypothetical protein